MRGWQAGLIGKENLAVLWAQPGAGSRALDYLR